MTLVLIVHRLRPRMILFSMRSIIQLLQACQSTPRIRDTNHLFLELPLLQDKLQEYVNKMSIDGSWSQNAIQVTNGWFKEGLKPRCITRDLKWGVPVPHEKFKDKVSWSIMILFILLASFFLIF